MNIDLKNVISQSITANQILERISPCDIFLHYVGDFKVGKTINSPLRIDEKPSFGIFVSKYDGQLRFNDFREGSGNCFEFVKLKYNCSYQEALHIIDRDFNLNLAYEISDYTQGRIDKIIKKPVISNYVPQPKSRIKIKVSVRNWNNNDKVYWFDKYKVNLETLTKYEVYPISNFWMDNQMFYVQKLAYAYYFEPGIFKIYQPELQVGQGKWFTNLDTGTKWHGYKQLPDKADFMFITKSLKDVMVLSELGFVAISPHNETPNIPEKIIDNLKSRFNKIYVYYDNDTTGVLNSTIVCNKYGFDYINNPKEYPKDPSDFIEHYDKVQLKEMILNLISKK